MSVRQRKDSERRTFEKLAKRLPADLRDLAEALSPEERKRYEECQRSVTEAQRHAQENEGYRVIL